MPAPQSLTSVTMRWLTLLVLLLVNVVYVYIGGAIFYLVEGKSSNLVSFNSLIDQVFEGEIVANRSKLADLVIAAIEINQQGHLVGPWNNSARLGILWDYQNSVFFTATIVTSIGYGYLAPRTDTGRYLCLVFACLGIPLFMAFISLLGDKLKQSTHWLTQHGRLKDKESLGKIVRLLFFIMVGSGLFLLSPAYCFSIMEGWSFQESIYYGFVTLSTIGFGDYVAGTNRSINYPIWYQVLRIIWIYTGLAWLAMVVRLQQDAIGVFVRARETDVVGIAAKTTRKVQASILKRLSRSSPLPEDDKDLRSSWLTLFRSSIISQKKREKVTQPKGHRNLFRTASAPIYETENLDATQQTKPTLPAIPSVSTSIEATGYMSPDLERREVPNQAYLTTLSANQVYVEVHDSFVIECSCEECHNVITVDRQTKINSNKHSDINSTSQDVTRQVDNGEAAIMQNEKNDIRTSSYRTKACPGTGNRRKHFCPKLDSVSNHNNSNRSTSSSLSNTSRSNHDQVNRESVDQQHKKQHLSHTLSNTTSKDLCNTLGYTINNTNEYDKQCESPVQRTDSHRRKRASFANNSRTKVWTDLESIQSTSRYDEDQRTGSVKGGKDGSEEKQDITSDRLSDKHKPIDSSDEVALNSAYDNLSTVNALQDCCATENSQRNNRRTRHSLSETPLCNIGQFCKEQVGFFVT